MNKLENIFNESLYNNPVFINEYKDSGSLLGIEKLIELNHFYEISRNFIDEELIDEVLYEMYDVLIELG